MKNFFKLLSFVAVLALTSCISSSTLKINPFRSVLFLDFQKIRDKGVEVTTAPPPEGAVEIGEYHETVNYGRYVSKHYEHTGTSSFNGMPLGKKVVEKKGSDEEDMEQLYSSIVGAVKEHGGRGIASLTVTQSPITFTGKTHAYLYTINGSIYK